MSSSSDTLDQLIFARDLDLLPRDVFARLTALLVPIRKQLARLIQRLEGR